MSYQRAITLDRARVNTETGEFRAVLFTDGEASDGHILDISGGSVPAQMPLFVNHYADPRGQLGSLYFDRKSQHQILVRGEIMLDGEGNEADIRRDILAKMAAGHVTRMSGRWDAKAEDTVRRTDLDPKHKHYVNRDKEKDYRKLYGRLFKRWIGLEGSVVGLGADPAATLRWSEDEDLQPHVRAFWREMHDIALADPAHTEEEPEEETDERSDHGTEEEAAEGLIITGTEQEAAERFIGLADPGATTMAVTSFEPLRLGSTIPPTEPDQNARLAAFAAQVRELVDVHKIDVDDVLTIVTENAQPEPDVNDVLAELRKEVAELQARVASLDDGRVDGSPPEPVLAGTPAALLRRMKQELRENRKEVLAAARQLIDERRGRIQEERKRDGRAAAFDELRKLLLSGVK